MTSELLDRGVGAIGFSKIADQNTGLSGSSVLFVYRPKISDRLVYRHFLNRVLNLRIATIFPLFKKIPFPIQSETILRDSDWNINDIVGGTVYNFHTNHQSESADFLLKLRPRLSERTTESTPLVILIDTIQKLETELECELRYIIRDVAETNISLWIHCPINSISKDLISSIGKLIAIFPTRNEITILSEQLPIEISSYPQNELSNGMLWYGFNPSGNNHWGVEELVKKL